MATSKTPKRPTGNFGSSSTRPNTFGCDGKLTTKKTSTKTSKKK